MTVADSPIAPIVPLDPSRLRRRFDHLDGHRQELRRQRGKRIERQALLKAYVELAPKIDAALEKLSDELFGKLAAVLEKNLTMALQEVLEQPIRLCVTRDFKKNASTMRFHIDNSGNEESIMKGQGGSVANILSVGLRLFALSRLDEARHRRFLVLDEQDCWLAPDRVPRLIKIIRQAGRDLGFQVIVISHHDLEMFDQWADKVIRLLPGADGVRVEEAGSAPTES